MKLHLLNKMLLFILLPALLGLCAVTGISYWRAESALSAQIAEELTLVIESQSGELENVTKMLRSVLKTGSEVARTKRFLLAENAKDSAQDLAALLPGVQASLHEIKANYDFFDGAGLLSLSGEVLAHTEAKMLGKNLADRAYFKAGLQGKPGLENVKSAKTGKMTTIFSAPVLDQGKVLGVLYATMDLARLSVDTTDSIKIGKTGICFVYDGQGTMLMHPNKEYIGDQDGNLDWVQTILKRHDGRLNYVWDGKEKVAYFRDIPGMDWYMVVAVEHSDVFAPVKALLKDNMLVGGMAALIVGLIIFVVARNVAGALTGGAAFVEHVAAGNLTLTPEQKKSLAEASARGDEIGTLAKGIGRMVENIRALFEESAQKAKEAEQAGNEAREAMHQAEAARTAAENARREGMLAAAGQLEGVAAVVSSASTELSAHIEQSDRGAAESAQRLGEAATAMNEMNATVQEVAQNAASASGASTETRQKAESGARIVEKAVQSIGEVHRVSVALKGDMTQLNEHAQAITRIMSVISDIADQTNLLALNAAIEAARAGDAGRGFAVVADEVRKLAEKTMASTNDVGNAIKAIQESTAKSAASVDSAVTQIEQATEFANESGAALQEIVATVEATADQVSAIATASEEQSAASEEINRSIVQVNEMSRQTAAAMADAAKSVADLAAQARELNRLIEKMKQG